MTLADVLRQKGKERVFWLPVSLHMHIPGLCAGGIRKKTEEMNFPVPEERCQTDACWDRSHTHHAQNISPRNETYLNSQCARVHLSLCRTDECVMCMLVCKDIWSSKERISDIFSHFSGLYDVCVLQQVPQERAEIHVHVIDRDYGMASCRVWTWNTKQMLHEGIHKTVIPEYIHSSAAQPTRNIPPKTRRTGNEKDAEGMDEVLLSGHLKCMHVWKMVFCRYNR